MGPIKEEYERFLSNAIPPFLPNELQTAMSTAFYAGVVSLLKIFEEKREELNSIEEAEELLEKLKKELFNNDIVQMATKINPRDLNEN